jgi:two-component system, response regulator PdtaR
VRHLIVAFAAQAAAQKVKAVLQNAGLAVRGVCASGAQVLQLAAQCDGGGLVICPIRFPDMSAREIMSLLSEDFDMLVLVTSRQQSLIGGSGIFALAEPVNAASIISSARQLLETRQLRAIGFMDGAGEPRSTAVPETGRKSDRESSHGRSTEEQKVIEQAKYLLMNRKRISEAEAHRYLQKKSMESGIRLIELAHRIIAPS